MNDTKLFYKWILPIATIFFGCATLGSFIDSKLDTNNLVKVTGEVSNFYYTKSYTQYSRYSQLNLKLYDGNVYKVSSEWEAKFPMIIKELGKSSKVELYHRKPFQRIYRLGTSNIIYQLKIGESTIIDINERKSKSMNLLYFTGFISVIGFSTILVRRKLKTQHAPIY